MNPMARGHALEAVEHLLSIDADRLAAEATAEAGQRLAAVGDEALRVTLVVSDDIGGMWTDRGGTELALRFGLALFDPRGGVARGSAARSARDWITPIAWASNRLSPADVQALVLASIYRVAYQGIHGPATTLGAMLVQEAFTERFAGRAVKPPQDGAAAAVDRAWDAADTPTVYAAWNGDHFAELMGYTPLGLDTTDALAVAMRRATGDPVKALCVPD
jgi:hypothetical protein